MAKINPIEQNPDKIKLLEIFDNSFPKRDYVIIHEATEFTSVCPKTGQPDFGNIILSYIPDKKCVELKSYKFYLQSFRHEGIFYENVTNRILEDLVSVLKPRWMEVQGNFSLRGGIKSKIIATHGKRK